MPSSSTSTTFTPTSYASTSPAASIRARRCPASAGFRCCDRGQGRSAGANGGVRARRRGDIFSNPVACHMAAELLDAPVLVVVFNNGRWNAVADSARRLAPDGWAVRTDNFPLTELAPVPSYAGIAGGMRGVFRGGRCSRRSACRARAHAEVCARGTSGGVARRQVCLSGLPASPRHSVPVMPARSRRTSRW